MALLKKNHTSTIQSLLSDPLLPTRVREATPEVLVKWIHEVGLEDSGEIISFASIRQIEEIFDTDLWKQEKAGSDESFDVVRFSVWLEILCEAGFESAAKRVVEMDEDFLVMAFHELAWIVELEWLEACCEYDHRVEKIMESKLSFEVDSFIVFGKVEQGWDVFVSLLAELDMKHHSFLYRILGRCSDLFIQDAGDDLYEVFSSEEQLIDDVAYAREGRREEKGFVAPSMARSFLKLCEMDISVEDLVSPKVLTRAVGKSLPKGHSEDAVVVKESIHRFSGIRGVFEEYPERQSLLSDQITYLANTLMSGWTWNNEERRPGRAIEIVLEACEEGLRISGEPFESFVKTFRFGWARWKKIRR